MHHSSSQGSNMQEPSTHSSELGDKLAEVQQQINSACREAQRDTTEVRLLAVSKTKPTAAIEQAYQAGQRAFGENYVQEGVDKVQQLAHLKDIEWHFIGPLQSNKTKLVAAHFAWCQSIDRLKIAKRLSEQRPTELVPLNVLIQVNIDDEDSKAGIAPHQLSDLAAQIVQLPNLSLRGVMAIPAAQASATQQQQSFQQLHKLFAELQQTYPSVDTLSLGMSNDLTQAIANGSTMVRIGSAIFGSRN